ncbi:hypothetical protein TNIN_428701 [Trichonephila inaurata madagascariensis]|uniref:Uncharacterized protein n=1 Tax=Trichonephila inaurata madagascariensis TaxID=2747483 RepID=A0A8X7CM80_9ARAC|nr:hypothetical protein TNIN_428701 [Trichonephila inaurata madagascariensis]
MHPKQDRILLSKHGHALEAGPSSANQTRDMPLMQDRILPSKNGHAHDAGQSFATQTLDITLTQYTFYHSGRWTEFCHHDQGHNLGQ